jgi:hypothetical protein
MLNARLLVLAAALPACAFLGGCSLLMDAAGAWGGLPGAPYRGRTWTSQARLYEAGYSQCPACRGTGNCPHCESGFPFLGRRSSCRACGGSRMCETCRGTGVVE